MFKQIRVLALLSLLMAFSQAHCLGVSKTPPSHPNFVFIFADDQAPNSIAAYGNTQIKTPNLDRLAQQGMNFRNAYNMGAWDGAVCKASRAMLNSGLSVWQAHQQVNKEPQQKRIMQSWSKLLEQGGYNTYFTGKWHVQMPVEKVFTHAIHERSGMPKDAWDHHTQVKRFADFEAGTGEYSHYSEFMPVGYNRPLDATDKSWSPIDTKQGGFYEGGQHWSETLKDDALSFIDEAAKNTNTPFFMYLAFNAPHDPRQAPQEYQDLYNHKDIALPANWQALYPEYSLIGNGPNLRDAALAPFPRTPYATKVHIKEYYALISHLDTQIGHILKALETKGLRENTYIIYTADHGLAVGEHGLFGKQNMYEHSMRAPLIIVGPKVKANSHIYSDIYLQDIMPTTLKLANIDIPQHVFFKPLTAFLKGENTSPHHTYIYGAYKNNQRMIKQEQFKLIVYPKAKRIKLFNLEQDPLEQNDLSNIPEHKKRMKTLFNALKLAQVDMNDELRLDDFFIISAL